MMKHFPRCKPHNVAPLSHVTHASCGNLRWHQLCTSDSSIIWKTLCDTSGSIGMRGLLQWGCHCRCSNTCSTLSSPGNKFDKGYKLTTIGWLPEVHRKKEKFKCHLR